MRKITESASEKTKTNKWNGLKKQTIPILPKPNPTNPGGGSDSAGPKPIRPSPKR